MILSQLRRPTAAWLLAWCAALFAIAWLIAAAAGDSIALSASRIHLDPDDPATQSVGRLMWRGGIEITARDPRLGGLSALLISPDGARLTAVSDEGQWLTARPSYDAQGRLVGLGEAEIGPLRGTDGKPFKGKRWQDAESLARLPDGSVLVGFEHTHRILRYPASDDGLAGRPAPWPAPAALSEAPDNDGLEALVALADGRLLAITEDQGYGDGVAAYLWHDGTWSRLTYPRRDGFRPTGAALLPDGDVVVLERQRLLLAGLTARLVEIAASDIRPGARLEGREIARWSLPLTIDNFEGVAARRGSGGETLIYLISDDNFHPLQRTLLVMFALEE